MVELLETIGIILEIAGLSERIIHFLMKKWRKETLQYYLEAIFANAFEHLKYNILNLFPPEEYSFIKEINNLFTDGSEYKKLLKEMKKSSFISSMFNYILGKNLNIDKYMALYMTLNLEYIIVNSIKSLFIHNKKIQQISNYESTRDYVNTVKILVKDKYYTTQRILEIQDQIKRFFHIQKQGLVIIGPAYSGKNVILSKTIMDYTLENIRNLPRRFYYIDLRDISFKRFNRIINTFVNFYNRNKVVLILDNFHDFEINNDEMEKFFGLLNRQQIKHIIITRFIKKYVNDECIFRRERKHRYNIILMPWQDIGNHFLSIIRNKLLKECNIPITTDLLKNTPPYILYNIQRNLNNKSCKEINEEISEHKSAGLYLFKLMDEVIEDEVSSIPNHLCDILGVVTSVSSLNIKTSLRDLIQIYRRVHGEKTNDFENIKNNFWKTINEISTLIVYDYYNDSITIPNTYVAKAIINKIEYQSREHVLCSYIIEKCFNRFLDENCISNVFYSILKNNEIDIGIRVFEYLKNELKKYNSLNSRVALTIIYNRLAALYNKAYRLGGDNTAKEYHELSLALSDTIIDEILYEKAYALFGLARTILKHYNDIADIHRAIELYRQSINILKQVRRHPLKTLYLGYNYQGLSRCYLILYESINKKEYIDNAKRYLEESERYFNEHLSRNQDFYGALKAIGFNYVKLGEIAELERDYKNAQQYFERCLEIAKKVNDTKLYCISLYKLCKTIISEILSRIEQAETITNIDIRLKLLEDYLNILYMVSTKINEQACKRYYWQSRMEYEILKLAQTGNRTYHCGELNKLLRHLLDLSSTNRHYKIIQEYRKKIKKYCKT